MRQVLFRSAHALPHIATIWVRANQLENAIESLIVEDCRRASSTGSFWGRLIVGDVMIEFRAYTLADGSINVGTYYKAKVV